MAEAGKAVEVPLFIKKKHELSKLLTAVESGSLDAVELIINTMNAPEDKVPLKTKLECAKIVVDLQIRVSESISKDQLTRQIAEIKANGLSKPLELEPGERRRLPPTTDFTTIQEVK